MKLSEIGNRDFRTASSLEIDYLYPDISFAAWALSGAIGDTCSDADPFLCGIGELSKDISDYDVLIFSSVMPAYTSEKEIFILGYFSVTLGGAESKKLYSAVS